MACTKETPKAPSAPKAEPPKVALTQPEAKPGPPKLDLQDPQNCKSCHAGIVEEWEGSMHAKAHHSKDPIYAGLRRIRSKREGAKVQGACANCHHPLGEPDFEGPIAKSGVSCMSCHGVAEIHAPEKKGKLAFRYDAENRVYGPKGSQDQAVHRGGPPAAHFVKSDQLCGSCHSAMKNPAGLFTCSTGVEHQALASKQSCASCHMPAVQGPASLGSTAKTHVSHRFFGPRAGWEDPKYRLEPTDVQLSLDWRGRKLTVTLENTAEHDAPTGFPGRQFILKVTGLDRKNQAVWSNFKTDPMKESPESVIHRVFLDQAGKVILAPYGVKVVDNRLKAGEKRKLQFKLPRGLKKVEAKLLMRLLPPPAAKNFGVEGPLAETRVHASSVAP